MRTAVLGCGLISGRWIRALSRDPRITIAALIDPRRDAATAAMDRAGIVDVPWFADLDTALPATDLDLVVNLTPADEHVRQTRAALDHGLHVFTEKPLALRLPDAEAVVAQARSAGLVLAVMANRGHDSRLLAFRDAVHAAGPGPYTVTAEVFVRLLTPGFRTGLAFPAVADLAVHAFDQVLRIVSAPPTSITCVETPLPHLGGHSSVASAVVRFDDGSVFAYRGGFAGVGQRTPANGCWQVDLSDAGLRWDGAETLTTSHVTDPDHPAITLLPPSGDGHQGCITAMIDAAHGGPPPPDGLDSVALLDAALRSARSNRPIPVTRPGR